MKAPERTNVLEVPVVAGPYLRYRSVRETLRVQKEKVRRVEFNLNLLTMGGGRAIYPHALAAIARMSLPSLVSRAVQRWAPGRRS
jgi:hypothetical protein